LSATEPDIGDVQLVVKIEQSLGKYFHHLQLKKTELTSAQETAQNT
jgi:hypothetical protein